MCRLPQRSEAAGFSMQKSISFGSGAHSCVTSQEAITLASLKDAASSSEIVTFLRSSSSTCARV